MIQVPSIQAPLFSLSEQRFELPGADLHYLPGFIPNEADWYRELSAMLVWHQDTIRVYGREVLIPRLNAWYGDAEAVYSYSGLALEPQAWTSGLLELKRRVEKHVQRGFNSVLANWYRDGKDSVSWHADDEPELGSQPLITSLSFGATRRFSLRRRDRQGKTVHIDLAGGSLLVMAGDTQRHWVHQVAKSSRCQSGRINLTFRQII